MEEDKKVFVDSNFFVAFFNIRDVLQQRAIKIAEKLEKEKLVLVISNFIFLEVVTVLSQKISKCVALEIGKYLLESPQIQIVHIDEELQNQTWQIFSTAENKNISFVDCSIVAAMKAENLHRLLTFDIQDFQKLRKRYKFELLSV